jgi:hypothetical protein
MRKRISKILLALLGAFLATIVRPTAAHAQEHASTFALIVTNNRSTRLSRPDLRYADDDGAKYHEMFRMLAPESNVALLTTFDADTQKLFPDLVGKVRPPTTGNVRAAAKALAERIQAARAVGPVDFYFVFAGHGDVDHGKGFLELEDGPFTSDDLQALLRSMPRARAHVILDSCNAFFAILARKPGGRHFVTSEEAQRSLAERLPDVGVFLSTSAEGNVYEWSSIQSGIFSHAVRSGLAGAADADGDGHVTYDELRAFVGIASKEVKNPAYRPQVFARGPGGRGGAEIFDLTRAKGKRLRLDERQQRLTVRDGSDVPWFDLHKEAGKAATLLVPERVGAHGAVEETSADAPRARYAIPAEESQAEIALASLPAAATTADARGGADEIFRALFAEPFGPGAYARFVAAERTAAPLVLGVSSDERERLRVLLRETADSAERRRILLGAATVSLAAGFAATGGIVLERGIREGDASRYALGGAFLAGGTFFGVVNLIAMVRPSFEERTYESFSRSLTLAPDTLQAQRVFAEAERRLLSAAESDRSARKWNGVLGLATVAGYGGILAYQIADKNGDLSQLPPVPTALFASVALFGATIAVDSLFPTTTERMANVWKNDPDLVRSRTTSGVRVTPVFGLMSAGIRGTF